MRRMSYLVSATVFLAAFALVASSITLRPSAPSGPEAAAVAAPRPPASAPAPEGPAEREPAAPIPGDAIAGTPAPRALPGAASMILRVDPETGQLTLPEPALDRALTIEEMQALARAEAEGLVTLRHPDGSETLNHEGRFADHSIARVGPDGKVSFQCVLGEGQLAHALRLTPTAAPAAEEQ
jgi:hypothetical protein